MRLTKKRVKELIKSMKNDRKELYCDFFNACRTIDRETMHVIVKYNYLGGQLDAYQKILQIMQIKVKLK